MEPDKALPIALRILGAISDREPPDEADLAKLRTHKPSLAYLRPDELAREVIQDIIRKKREEGHRLPYRPPRAG